MRINIAILAPSPGIGGGNRKYKIYFDNLDTSLFKKFYLFIDETVKKPTKIDALTYRINKDSLNDFVRMHDINFFYEGTYLEKSILDVLRKEVFILKNVNFVDVYSENPKDINLVISNTDYLKLDLMNDRLNNAHVVYNPIDVAKWTRLSGSGSAYRSYFKGKNVRYIVGRLGRAEPTKWNFLILKTIRDLQKSDNYNYGFIFAGMPLLYRKALRFLMDKEMKKNVLLVPELRTDNELSKFYNSIDLFWQTSRIGESFGNVIAEAFCFGVPVITDYKRFLDENGKIHKKRYDAQIELVDHGKNGAYCNYPGSVIHFLEKNNMKSLKKLGQYGKNKAKTEYDVKKTTRTLAKILYTYLRRDRKSSKDNKFESIKQIPLQKDVITYVKEYNRRIDEALENNHISPSKLLTYRIQEKLWNAIEFIYVIIRKILRSAGIDVEVFKNEKNNQR